MNITLYPLGDYNEGNHCAFTIDLDTLFDREEYLQEVAKGLWEHSRGGNVVSTQCKDCGHVVISQQLKECPECGSEDVDHKITNEEWIVCDYEGIPKQFVGEYDLSDDFWAYSEFLDNTALDQEAVDAGLDCDIPLDKIEDAYQGEFESDEDFAQQLAEDVGDLRDDLRWPYTCIDWEWAARDLMYDYTASDGHYFSSNW
jgi:antirestriction protein